MTAQERAEALATKWYQGWDEDDQVELIGGLSKQVTEAIQAAERDMAERVKRIVMDYRNKFGMDTEAQAVILERIAAMQNEVRP